jgi:hypothetical protein
LAPLVGSVALNWGPMIGGITVTLAGIGFIGATAMLFGGTVASSFTVVSTVRITAVPMHEPAPSR